MPSHQAMSEILKGYWMDENENVMTVWDTQTGKNTASSEALGLYRGSSNLLLGRISYEGVRGGIFYAEFGTDRVWKMRFEDAVKLHGTWLGESKGSI